MDLNASELELETEEELLDESYSDEVPATLLESIYSLENKVLDDLDLIAIVEGNPRLYAKGNAGYRNAQEKEMAWISVGKALKNSISGTEAKHRWDTLRNLYGRSRREILALTEQQGLSGSGRDDVSYENLLTPQCKAIHRFMAKLYIPRKSISNYAKSSLSTPCPSSSSSASKKRVPLRTHARSLLVKPPSRQLLSELTTSSSNNSLADSPLLHRNYDKLFESNEGIDDLVSEHEFKVPESDIKRRRKNKDLETESMIIQSSQAITAACSALPTLLSNTVPKKDTEEEKGMVAILSEGLKRVPTQQRTKCLIKLLEILDIFQQHDLIDLITETE